jgi:hypothetical protein
VVVVAAGVGALAVCAAGLAVAAGVAASAADGTTVSEDGLTFVAGRVASAAFVAESLRGWADGRAE